MNLSIETVKQRMSPLGLNKKSDPTESQINKQLLDEEKEIPDTIWNAVRGLNGRARICSAPGGGRYYTLDGRTVPVTEIMKAAGVVKESDSPKKRRGRPPKKSTPTEEGEYPIIRGFGGCAASHVEGTGPARAFRAILVGSPWVVVTVPALVLCARL